MVIRNEAWTKEVVWYGQAFKDGGTEFCHMLWPEVNSHGVWEKVAYKEKGMGMWNYPLPLLEIVILTVFVLWQSFHLLFKILGIPIPKFTSMMLAGVVLSQASRLSNNFLMRQMFLPHDYWPKIPETFGAFGFTMYWFLKGVKMDVGMIPRTGRKATVTGITTVLVPIIAANFVFGSRQKTGGNTLKPAEYRIMIFMQSLSAFTGIAQLLRDLKIHHSELGRIALSSAMVADMVGLGINVLALFMWFESKKKAIKEILGVLAFIVFTVYILRPAMFWVIRRTPEGRPVRDIYIYAILMFVFFSLLCWRELGQYPPFGAFIFGLAVPDGPPLGSALIQRFESFNAGVILPVFICLGMMQLNGPWLVQELRNLKHLESQVFEATFLVLFIFMAKFAASAIPPYAAKMPLKDSIVLALVLCHKGIVELSYYAFGVEEKIVGAKTFSIMAMFILLNSFFMPIAIGYLYDPSKRFAGYQKRNLMYLKPSSELRTLVCLHKPDHITSMINILEASSPSENSHLTCYVLHLIELVGQESPIFISHKFQKPKVGSRSYSDNVIISFEQFSRNCLNSVSVDTFTSISIPKYMHEDICCLALDKSASLILLPFHRTWSIDRTTIVSEDEMTRNLNCNVLRRAPCSVGIFVDRKTIRETPKTESCYQVCAIFVGGKDDREALALAKRMAQNTHVILTVVRFVPTESNGESTRWDQMLDMAELKDLTRNKDVDEGQHNSVKYTEERVKDGTETSMILQRMAYDYDLFLVGRSSAAGNDVMRGLGDWSEFEELGVIGDLLASPDFSTRASVLVVQQQQNIATARS